MFLDVGTTKFNIRQSGTYSALVGMGLGFKGEDNTLFVDILDDNGGKAYISNDVLCDVYNEHGDCLIKDIEAQEDELTSKWKVVIPKECASKVGTKLVRWRVEGESVSGFQFFTVIDVPVVMLLSRLRIMLDKSLKDVSKSWGYSDADLFMYLVNAVGYFNTVPPLTGYSIGNLPFILNDVIVELAQLYALQSQSIYAIDTDVPSYSDQGISISIDHFAKLNQEYANVASRILDNVKKIKWKMGGRPRALVMFNPERAMNYVFTQFITPGFPYFVWGIGLYNVVFSRV